MIHTYVKVPKSSKKKSKKEKEGKQVEEKSS
jgi:hypothetical protein